MSAQVVLFPPELVARVKAEYPDNPYKLHEALDSGNRTWVSYVLVVCGSKSFSPVQVRDMIKLGQIKELLEQAERNISRDKLHSDWVSAVYTEKDREEEDRNRP